MRFGHFDDLHREYVIERPDTPLPWINYLGLQDYFAIISNTAGGYSFYQDARLRRLTRYRYNNAPLDQGGRYVYLRDDGATAGAPAYWSPTWMPTTTELDEYECRHGLGYTTIRSRYLGISADVLYFVPLDENLEIWRLRLQNHRSEAAELSVFAAVEFCLWDALEDATNFQRNLSIGEVEPPALSGRTPGDRAILHTTEYRERRNHFAYFACSEPLASFDTDRQAFLGPYRGWDRPLAVERGTGANSIAHGWQPIGAQHAKVGLEPGQSRELHFILGYAENPKEEKFLPGPQPRLNREKMSLALDRFPDAAAVDGAFHAHQSHWHTLLTTLSVNTPDENTNRMVNIWNVYQIMATFNISRSASYFESGVGRGMGFRDSSQDLMAFVQVDAARARQRLLDLAATQLPSGGAYHQYQPLTKRGNNDIGSGFNDDPLWLVLAAAAYVKETGDRSVLLEAVPYDNAPGSESPLHEHLAKSLRYTMDRLGPHGLPLIGRADWNDCLNLNCFSETPGESFQTTTNKDGQVAESVFIAGLFILAAREFARVVGALEKGGGSTLLSASLPDYLEAARRLEAAIWDHGWDGEWFRRAYDDHGQPVGSHVNDEGQIFIESQGMCIMAGMGISDGRAVKALDSVSRRLATPHGILLHQPAFTRYYLNLGEISTYPPGYKENAAVFCHTNAWIVIAEARAGRGDRALDYYLRINPSARESLSEVHRCEPYVYSQMIAGRDAPDQGEAKNSWLTGAAAWNYIAATQWILGIRPELHGLLIDPCIPAAWDGFTAERTFRGLRLKLQVHNPQHVSHGVRRVTVDGIELVGNLIPDDLPGGDHSVEAWLGH